MNFTDWQEEAITRFSSLVEQDDPTALPLGVAAVARNVKYHLTSVRTRDGIRSDWGFSTGNLKQITGLASLKLGGNPDTQIPLVYDQGGNLKVESPVGSGVLVPITSAQVTLPQFSLQAAAAYKKAYLAFTDLLSTQAAPAVLNLQTLNLDPLSAKPTGVPWSANTVYQVGDTVTPSTPVGGNSHIYRCTVAGTSGAAQPVFPVTEGGTIADNGITWTETTPVMAQTLQLLLQTAPTVNRVGAAGTFAAARDVYIVVTLTNGNGESALSTIFIFLNTTLNDGFTVVSPVLPTWVQQLAGANAVTGYSVYEADVAHGNAAPLPTAFKAFGGLTAIGANLTVTTTATGAVVPQVDNSRIVPVGNICSGLRYALVLGVNRNGYITGVAQAAIVSYNPASSPGDGLQLYMAHLPTFPSPSTAARIVALTPAGQLSSAAGNGISSAGPYFWISPNFPNGIFDLSTIAAGVTVAEVVNGIAMTSTLINDNTTTSATFNFTDDYLKLTLNDVSSYFRKIQVPSAADVYYSANLKRMFYAADTLKSGWYVSLLDDPESIYGDTSIMQVAQDNGFNRVAIRDYKTNTYAMKEDSGWLVSPSADNPADWLPVKQWSGSGPCGFRAVDVCTTFMAYVHRSGVWIYKGGDPLLISLELPITWTKVNWAAKHTIWIMIDDETREIRVGVPYGPNVTEPSLVLKCNYEESPDFGRPIHFSPYIGKEIAAGTCYKWSIDDIAANVCIRAERKLVNPPPDMDLATTQSQILFGSSNPDGVVSASVPFVFNDNGMPINSVFETVCPEEFLKPSQLGGVQANVDGQGVNRAEVLAMRAKDPSDGPSADRRQVIALKKPLIAGIPYACGARGNYEKYRLRVSNGNQKDVWFDLKWAAIYARVTSAARHG
ncbi:MAG TPA: hypothetical protein VGQ12_07600 [Candidatus Angelobacter sp.]|jgi:hypothetical protein|nr:hypothetical protein [Candidatus Angelobacter sp.]